MLESKYNDILNEFSGKDFSTNSTKVLLKNILDNSFNDINFGNIDEIKDVILSKFIIRELFNGVEITQSDNLVFNCTFLTTNESYNKNVLIKLCKHIDNISKSFITPMFNESEMLVALNFETYPHLTKIKLCKVTERLEKLSTPHYDSFDIFYLIMYQLNTNRYEEVYEYLHMNELDDINTDLMNNTFYNFYKELDDSGKYKSTFIKTLNKIPKDLYKFNARTNSIYIRLRENLNNSPIKLKLKYLIQYNFIKKEYSLYVDIKNEEDIYDIDTFMKILSSSVSEIKSYIYNKLGISPTTYFKFRNLDMLKHASSIMEFLKEEWNVTDLFYESILNNLYGNKIYNNRTFLGHNSLKGDYVIYYSNNSIIYNIDTFENDYDMTIVNISEIPYLLAYNYHAPLLTSIC